MKLRIPPTETTRRVLVVEVEGDVTRAVLVAEERGQLALVRVQHLSRPGELVPLARSWSCGHGTHFVYVGDDFVPGEASKDERFEPWDSELTVAGSGITQVFALAGLPLGNLTSLPATPALFLQVERRLLVLAELVDGRVRSLECRRVETPTLEVCRELVGVAPPEVLLAGRGLDLSAVGYELVRDGSTWVRIVRPAATVWPALRDEPDLSAVAAAARHALAHSDPLLRA